MNQQICEICIWNQNKPNMSGLGLWFDSAFLSTESVLKKKKKHNSLSVLSGKELVNKITLSADSCLIFIESPEFNHGNFESQMKKRSPPGRSASSSVYSWLIINFWVFILLFQSFLTSEFTLFALFFFLYFSRKKKTKGTYDLPYWDRAGNLQLHISSWVEEPGRLQSMSRTRLSDFTFTFHFHALEKEMAAHSSVLAWRVPGTGEPDGLLSMGSHRVGHDWSDLAAAAAAAAAAAEGSPAL